MSAVASIVLPDAQGTPVNHTFVPMGPDANGTWWWEDQSPSAVVGYNRVSARLTRPQVATSGTSSKSDRVNRIRLTFSGPSLETLGTSDSGLTPPPTVAYVDRFALEFMLAERNTLQNKKDARKYAIGLLADAQIVAMIETLVNVY